MRHLDRQAPRRVRGRRGTVALCAASHLRGGSDHVKCCAELKPAGATPIEAGQSRIKSQTEEKMAWTTPVIVEVCVGMEITSYESAEI